jgi:DNA-binding transcriptional MerR regulator
MEGLVDRSKAGPPAKQYRIGEIADYTGVSRQTVHNYTVMGLIRESRWTRGGHRLYDETVFDRLFRIGQLKTSRSLREIRTLFAAEQSEDVQSGAELS